MLLDVPKDIQLERTAAESPSPAWPAPALAAPALAAGAVERAADLLRTARRPVLYGGGGLINAGPQACAAFTALARRCQSPPAACVS